MIKNFDEYFRLDLRNMELNLKCLAAFKKENLRGWFRRSLRSMIYPR